MKRTLLKPICVVILTAGLIASSGFPALAEKGSQRQWRDHISPLRTDFPGENFPGAHFPGTHFPGANVLRLSSILVKLIKEVEDSTLPCETRNSVVRRLRKLDDALRSGHLSAAQALATAWRQHAWSLQAAQVLSPELGSSIQNRLSYIEGNIGVGGPVKPRRARHWKPLPSCEPSAGVVESSTGLLASASGDVVSGSYNPAVADPSADIKIFLKTALGLLNIVAPGSGTILPGLVDLMWPQGSGAEMNLFQELVDQAVYDLVATDLKGLGALLDDPDTGWIKQVEDWRSYCGKDLDSDACVEKARQSLWPSFQSKIDHFTGEGGRVRFQQNESHDYRLDLLPLFAQFENLYLSLLSDGILLHKYWKDRRDLDKSWVDLDDNMAENAMADELNPNFTNKGVADRGIGYVNAIYSMGLDQQPLATQDGWNTRNAYIRDNILNVLDFRDMWKYMDPRAYPDGVPGGVKLTRMIYSDLVGYPRATPNLPSNVAGPLKEVLAWSKRLTSGASETAIAAVQATSPPLLGPAQSGAITGDTTPRSTNPRYYNLGALGPIIKAKAQESMVCGGWSSIGFSWATGGADSWQGWRNPNYHDIVFSYDDEVLATVQVINHVDCGKQDGTIADSFVFGFRYADSFDPAGQVIGVHSGKCIDLDLGSWLDLESWNNGTQAVIRSCSNPPTPRQIWTYDPGLQQISVTNPAEWSDANPTDSGKHCLDTGGTLGSGVYINACDDGAVTYDANDEPVTSSQRWTIEAVGAGIGKITNVKSGLVLDYSSDADGTPLTMNDYSLSLTSQQWYAHDPLTGEIHGIGSSRCLDLPSWSSGTQALIHDCHGGTSQQWTYRPDSKELAVTSPSGPMCLEARNGGTTAGTAVQINTCTGTVQQQWTLHGDGNAISNDKSGLVLDVKGGNTANGTLVQLYTSNSTGAQQWSRTSSRGGALHAVGAAKCLDLPESEWSDGTQAVIHSCYSPLGAAQTWTYHPIAQTYTVDSPTGLKCLDARDSGTTDGTAVVINDCTGAASQRWTRDFGSSTVTNVNSVQYGADGTVLSKLVLDLTGGGTTDGTLVQLSTQATPVPTPSQKWVWSLD